MAGGSSSAITEEERHHDFVTRDVALKQILEAGKDGNGKVLTEGERKEYAEAIAGIAPVQEEFKSIVDRVVQKASV